MTDGAAGELYGSVGVVVAGNATIRIVSSSEAKTNSM
jgi:hypothetical protein